MREQLTRPLVDSVELAEQLASRIAHWQGQFDALPVDEVTSDLREYAEADLDQYCSHLDQSCLFSGIGRIASGPYDSEASEDFVDDETGYSHGMVIVKFGKPGQQRWMVSHAFEQPVSGFATDGPRGFVFLEPSRTTIFALSRAEESYETIDQPHAVLSILSEALAANLLDPEFLELNAAEQRHYMYSALAMARSEVEEWGSIDGRTVIVEAQRGYIRDAERTIGSYAAKALENTPIGGVCRGIDVLALNRLRWSTAISGVEQLVDKAAGLFLVVQPDQDSAETHGLSPGQLLYVPISGQEIGVSFLEIYDPADSE